MTPSLLDRPKVGACKNCGTYSLWIDGVFPQTYYVLVFPGAPMSVCAAQCDPVIEYTVEDIKAFLAEIADAGGVS